MFHLCSAHTSNIVSSWNWNVHDVLCGMACHSSLKSNSLLFQVPWGIVSLLDLITEQCPHVFNWVDVRGLCKPVHHINPSISEECCGKLLAVCGRVLSCWKHLYLWMVLHEWLHLLLQDFVPVPHSIEAPLDHEISTVPSRNPHPTPYEMHPLHICLFHWCMGLPVFCFFISILSLLHQPSQARTGFSSDIRIWFWIWFWIWIWSFIFRGTKAKWQDVEVRCLGGQNSGLQHWQKCDFGFLTVFIKRPVTHWWVGPRS